MAAGGLNSARWRIEEGGETGRGETGEAEGECPSAGGGQRPFGGLAQDGALEPVGQDQPFLGGKEVTGKPGTDREIETIGEGRIVAPFAVGAEIRGRALDLDDHAAAVATEGEQIGPPAVGEGELGQRNEIQARQQPGGAAGDFGRIPEPLHDLRSIPLNGLLTRRPLPWFVQATEGPPATGAAFVSSGIARRTSVTAATSPPMSRRRQALLRQGAAFAEQQKLGIADVEELARTRSPQARANIAAKLGGQYGELATTDNAGLAKAVLLLLVKDVEKEVRRALAEAVADCEELPPDIASRLARDDIEVARPVLERSPVLSDEELIDIVRTNSIQYALAVAGRERISEAVSEALVDSGDEQVVVRLTGNMGAELSRRTLQRIAEEFRESRSVQDRLVKRPALPYELVEQLVGVIGDRLQWELLRDRRISAEKARQIMEAIRDRVSVTLVAREHGDQGLERHLRERWVAGDLDGEDVLGFLRDGDIAAFETAFMVMSRLGIRTVRRLLYNSDRRCLAALCIKAGIATPHYVGIRMALELAEQCLEGQGGEKSYAGDTLMFVQAQYERLRLDVEKVEELIAQAEASVGERTEKAAAAPSTEPPLIEG